MNLFPLKGRSVERLALWLCLLCTATSGWPQTNLVPANRTSRRVTERVLFIFDISSDMEKRAANVRRIAGLLVSSGLNSQLDRGATIGVWTFNNELHTGEFPLQVWTPQAAGDISLGMGQFLQQQRYAKSPRLAPVMAQLTNVVADSDKITVILMSDGSEPLTGTMFDTQIAEAFKLNRDEQRRLDMPFVTILRAARGKFVSLKVNTPPWPIDIPAYPGETKPPEPTPAEPPPTVVIQSTNRPATNIPVAPAPLPKPEPHPRPVETNVVETPGTNATAAVEPTPPPVETPSNPPPVVIVPPKPVVANVVAQPVAPAEPTNTLVAAPAESDVPTVVKMALLPVLIGGGIILFGLVIVCLVLLKRSRETTRVSLITKSMNKDRK